MSRLKATICEMTLPERAEVVGVAFMVVNAPSASDAARLLAALPPHVAALFLGAVADMAADTAPGDDPVRALLQALDGPLSWASPLD